MNESGTSSGVVVTFLDSSFFVLSVVLSLFLPLCRAARALLPALQGRSGRPSRSAGPLGPSSAHTPRPAAKASVAVRVMPSRRLRQASLLQIWM